MPIVMQAGLQSSKCDFDPRQNSYSDCARNQYESLLEEAVQDEPEDDPVRPAKPPGRSTKEEPISSDRRYHMEVQHSQENAFMVFTLFTDLHKIKAEIRSLWDRCFKNGADMIVATSLTAHAMAFVQKSEERVLSILENSKCWEDFPSQEGSQDHAPSFPGTYCRLLNTLRDPADVQEVIRFEDSSDNVKQGREKVNITDLTFKFSARRLFFITRTTSCSFADPLLHLFTKDPHALLNADINRVLERDKSLCNLLFGLVRLGFVPVEILAEHCPELLRQGCSVREDPIIRYLNPLWSQKVVNLTAVFAAEVMLDIKDVCSSLLVSKPSYEEAFDRYLGALGVKILGYQGPLHMPMMTQTDDSPLLRGAGQEGWYEKVDEIMKKILLMFPTPDRFSDTYLVKEPRLEDSNLQCWDCLELYTKLERRAVKCTSTEFFKSGTIERIRLFADTNYIYENYPIFVPNREAFMQTMTESVAIEVLNVNKHVVSAMAHLYNASRQLGIGNLRWPTMDRVIQLHKVALFAGELPTVPAAMLKTFTHRNWGPRGRMSHKEKKRRINRAVTMMKPSAMTQAFIEHWNTAGRIPFWYALEANALAAAAEKKAGKKTQTPNNPSFFDSMPVMEEYLTKQLQDVRVDYMQIDKVGIDFYKDLLKHARGMFSKQGNRVLQPEDIDSWSGIDFVSESFEQETLLHEAMAKCGGDPSKLPIQDCDYLQDSINCLANALRAKSIGVDMDESVNMPTSLTRFRIRGSEDLPDISRLVLVSHCSCCHRKYHF